MQRAGSKKPIGSRAYGARSSQAERGGRASHADENYRAKFEELRALQAALAKKEEDAAAQAAEEEGLLGQDVPVAMDTDDDAALQESAQEWLEKLPEEERGGAKRLLDDFFEVQAKKAKGTPAVIAPPVVGAGPGV